MFAPSKASQSGVLPARKLWIPTGSSSCCAGAGEAQVILRKEGQVELFEETPNGLSADAILAAVGTQCQYSFSIATARAGNSAIQQCPSYGGFFSRHRERVFSTFAFTMKPKRTDSRKPAVISNSRWLAYATAGAASAFTCAHSADASIHYSGIIGSYSGRERTKSFRLQLDQPGDTFRLRHYVTLFTSDVYAHFGVRGLAGAGFAGFYCPSNPQLAGVSKLSRGQFISRRAFLARESGLIAGSFDVCSQQFGDGEIGFIGFKFNSGSGDQYGWVRIKMGNRADFWLIDYAYADPGEPIRAGQMSSNDIVPEEGSLGGLALGAAGLLAWRRTRSQAAR